MGWLCTHTELAGRWVPELWGWLTASLAQFLGQVTASLGLLGCLDLGPDFSVNNQDSSPSRGLLARDEAEGWGNSGVDAEILGFPERASS